MHFRLCQVITIVRMCLCLILLTKTVSFMFRFSNYFHIFFLMTCSVILCTTDSNRAALGHLIVLVQNEKISISQFLLIRTCLLSTKYCLIERSVKNLDSFLCLMHMIAVCKLTSFNKIYLNIKCANGVYNSDLHKSHDIFTFLGNIVGHFMSNKIFQHITNRSTNTETGSLILYNRKRVTYIVTSYCIMYTVYLTISVQIFKITI